MLQASQACLLVTGSVSPPVMPSVGLSCGMGRCPSLLRQSSIPSWNHRLRLVLFLTDSWAILTPPLPYEHGVKHLFEFLPSVLSDSYPAVRCWTIEGLYRCVFVELPCISTAVGPLHIPTSTAQGFQLPHAPPSTSFLSFDNSSHLNGCEVVAYCGVFL